MPPLSLLATSILKRGDGTPTRTSFSLDENVLEAWGGGFHVGALVILILLVLCNYRRRVLLHKLILLELFFALWHGTFIFCQDPVYGWYLSSTATLLFISYQLHNVISWIKIKPFLPRWGYLTFIITIIAVQPYWIAEAWSNFQYFNGLGNQSNVQTRPWEALARDPWWIFTTCRLIYAIKRDYKFTYLGLLRASPRFGIMIFCMLLSIVFLLTDVVVTIARVTQSSGINPYWRMALVFKCASDTIFLDDFKSVLDHIASIALGRASGWAYNSHRRPSAAPQVSANTTPQTGPSVTITSDGEHNAEPGRKLSFNALGGAFHPKLQIRKQTSITTTDEVREGRSRTASSNSHKSDDQILLKPQATKHRRPGIDHWGDDIVECDPSSVPSSVPETSRWR